MAGGTGQRPLPAPHLGQEVMALNCTRGGSSLILEKISSQKEEMAQAAQDGGGVSISGGVQETCRCGTEGHGLVGMELMD